MHGSVMEWVGDMVRRFGLADRRHLVLEVGSYDVNGSVRPLFDGVAGYIGVDIRPGPGVDEVVADDPDLTGLKWFDCFNVVVSTETLEHVERPWLVVDSMANMVKPGGHVLVTTRGFQYGRHDFPADYWRFAPETVAMLMRDAGLEVVHFREDPDPLSPGVFALGHRPC